MTERVHPSSKPIANGTTTTPAVSGGNPSFQAKKAQLYNPTRPAYRPQPGRSSSRRNCCCTCFLFLTLTILLLIFLSAIAAGVFWVIYRPQSLSFSVSSLQISQFNLTSSSQLTSKFNLTVTARNPNKKITFFYDPITVSISSDGDNVGDGSIPGFVLGTKNTTVLRTTLSISGQSVESTSLKLDLKNKNSFPLKIQLDTKVKVKIGKMKTKKVRIRVKCDGIKAAVPTGKSATTATTSNAKCKVDPRFKIWNWTI